MLAVLTGPVRRSISPAPPDSVQIAHELRLIEAAVFREHRVDGLAELLGQDRQCLALAVAAGLFLQPALCVGITLEEQHGRLAEGPAQVAVADLLVGFTDHLASGLLGTANQTGIGQKLSTGRETLDVLDLVEQHESEDLADAAYRAEQMIHLCIMALGLLHQLPLQLGQLLVIVVDEIQVQLHHATHGGIGKAVRYATAFGRLAEPDAEGRQVVLVHGVLDMGDQVCTLPGQVQAPAQQVAGGAHGGRIGVGLGQHAALEQQRDLVRIELVVLRLATVDGLHVQGMTEHEGNLLAGTEIGDPVPGEDALHRNHQVIPVGFDERHKAGRIGAYITMD